jgi:hypothetical protein
MQAKIKIPRMFRGERTGDLDFSTSGFGDFYVGKASDSGALHSLSSKQGTRPGSEDIEKSRFIDQVINRLRQ